MGTTKNAVMRRAIRYSGQRWALRLRCATTGALDNVAVEAAMLTLSDHPRLLVLDAQCPHENARVDQREDHDQQRVGGSDPDVMVVAVPGVSFARQHRQVAAGQRD